jgi:micrococcal nuclease
MKYFARFLLLCFFCGVLPSASVRAASLFGKVIEVNSGDVITIFNLNRPVRVKLLGVDAPELDQTFGDVAKKHLSDLVYDKSVLVEYSGIAADSSLTGRVLLNNSDIGAQMIRDGAAWFDVNNVSRLSVSDREVYQQCELAARNERRGLWQAENPTAPWEFVKAEALRRNPVARLNAMSPPKARGDRPIPELTNITLMAAGRNLGGIQTNGREELLSALTGTSKSWVQFRPEGEHFSVLAPEGGLRETVQDQEEGEVVDVHLYMVREGWSSYVLTWMKVPANGRTVQTALDEARQGILSGPRSYRDEGGQAFSCGPVPEMPLSMNGYAGTEYDLSSCSLPAKARVYVRKTGDYFQVYMALSVFLEKNNNVDRFLQSFTVGSPQKPKPRKR